MVIRRTGDRCVEHVSANVREILGVSVDNLLGARPSLAFPNPESAARLGEMPRPERLYFDDPAAPLANGRKFEAACHIRDNRTLVEIEPYVEAEHAHADKIAPLSSRSVRILIRRAVFSSRRLPSRVGRPIRRRYGHRCDHTV
jgi:light-regulated signal transduction histidine kinase (bacteriophytochrome)